jgi:hypothetical protein
MSRTGPRPHAWKVQGEIPHRQHLAWLQMRAQARFRNEPFDLTLEQFQTLWADHWHLRGRSVDSYCLVRIDILLPWQEGNVVCIPRMAHLQRNRRKQMETANGR